jgi:hypothetical protein
MRIERKNSLKHCYFCTVFTLVFTSEQVFYTSFMYLASYIQFKASLNLPPNVNISSFTGL